VTLSFLGRPLPPAFELRTFVVAPGGERPYAGADWHDALVVVERGEIELEWRNGARRRFGRGAVLWLSDLPLRTLRNRAREPALLVAVSRRRLNTPFNGALAPLIARLSERHDHRASTEECASPQSIDLRGRLSARVVPLSVFR
jgi:hypothetical protein